MTRSEKENYLGFALDNRFDVVRLLDVVFLILAAASLLLVSLADFCADFDPDVLAVDFFPESAARLAVVLAALFTAFFFVTVFFVSACSLAFC